MSPEPRGLAAFAARVEHYRLTFRWPERTASLLLPALFLLSVAVHGLALFVFQVVYPPAVASAPPPAQVTFLSPGTPQGDALLRWVAVQDPARAARAEGAAPAPLGEIGYTFSYAAAQTPPREAEAPREPAPFPAAHNLLDFTPGTAAAEPGNASRWGVPSGLRLSETLRTRESAGPSAPLRLRLKSTANNLRATIFLVAVGDRGEVRYCFLHASCGDRDMDTQGEALLRGHTFTVSETPLEWGFAAFTWGADAYAPASPTPSARP